MRIKEIGQLTAAECEKVGGKARGLDFLSKAGYRIARGFVVSEIGTLDEETSAALLAAFDALGAPLVSVRSSASNEDGDEYSNAGQYETCLNVAREGLIDAVERCLSSLCSARAAAYSEQFLESDTAQMNLVVEEMVDAAEAGVMFTKDPTDASSVLIESCDGLGENLVSGKTAAYRFSIPQSGFLMPKDKGNLDEAHLRTLYHEGLAIAEAAGYPTDLEWAVDKEGRLFWLQLRPITTEVADLFEFDPPEEKVAGHLFTSRNVGEMLPGAVTPLSLSTSVLAIDYGIREMFRYVGFLKSTEDMPPYSVIVPLGYHLFFDMTKIHEMKCAILIATPPSINVSIMGEYYEPCPPVEGKNRILPVRLFNCARFGKYLFSSKKAAARAEEIAATLAFREADTAEELYAAITEKLPVMNDVLSCHYICSSFSGSMNSALLMTLSKEFPSKEEYQAFLATILSDIEGIESADILRKLSELADAIRALAPDAATLDDEALLSLLHNPANSEVYTLYRAFLAAHGHRSIKEAELRSRGWRDNEPALLANIRTVLGGTVKPQEPRPFEPKKLFARFGAMKRRSLTWIARNARRAVCEREYSKSRIIRVIDKFKVQYRRLAALLTEKGLLPDEDAIYFLTHEEIGRLLGGEHTLAKTARARRAIFPEAEELVYPDVAIGAPKPLDMSDSVEGESLSGVPVSRGRVLGRARIVKTVEDAEQLEKGEIMVAAFTDIGWSPYYSVIGALVTEVGSALSHGAVVAREYSLPTIVNVKGATRRIKTGDALLVDATHGTITVLDEATFCELSRKELVNQ